MNDKIYNLISFQELNDIKNNKSEKYDLIENTIGEKDPNSGCIVINIKRTEEYFKWSGTMFDQNGNILPNGIFDPETDYYGFFLVEKIVETKWKYKHI